MIKQAAFIFSLSVCLAVGFLLHETLLPNLKAGQLLLAVLSSPVCSEHMYLDFLLTEVHFSTVPDIFTVLNTSVRHVTLDFIFKYRNFSSRLYLHAYPKN